MPKTSKPKKPRKSRATGNPIGRPPKYKSPEEIEPVIEQYFKDCDKGRKYKFIFPKGPVIETLPISYTKEGLAYALGFSQRSEINHYIKKALFTHTLKRAIMRIAVQRMDLALKKMIDPKIAQFDFINNQDNYKSQYQNQINIGIGIDLDKRLNQANSRVSQIPKKVGPVKRLNSSSQSGS